MHGWASIQVEGGGLLYSSTYHTETIQYSQNTEPGNDLCNYNKYLSQQKWTETNGLMRWIFANGTSLNWIHIQKFGFRYVCVPVLLLKLLIDVVLFNKEMRGLQILIFRGNRKTVHFCYAGVNGVVVQLMRNKIGDVYCTS
jgi:hypothetical protein